MSTAGLRVYIAGELFSSKHLLGNSVLAERIFEFSKGRYLPVLPQNIELRGQSPHSIRDQDIRTLLTCGAALFNYDGPELDSGTVIEFMFAKFADIPSVLLRTDFRSSGDQGPGGEPWNLMTSFYPRTRTVLVPAMGAYKDGPRFGEGDDAIAATLREGASTARAMEVITRAANEVIAALDGVIAEARVLTPDLEAPVRRWLELMPGFE
jgi:hypothetical protein